MLSSGDSNGLGVEPESVLDGPHDLGLTTTRVGRRVHYFESVDSTSTVLRALAEQGAEPGTVVVADEQTGGRGRAGRVWFSPPGDGVWMSVLHESLLPAERLAPLSVAAAVSVAEALAGETGLDVRVKWPNDLLVGGKKLAGLLVESVEVEGAQRVVLGAGVNVGLAADDIPEELVGTATSLSIELGTPVRRLDILRLVVEALERCFEEYELECVTAFRERWRRISSTLGREVTIAPGTAGRSGPLFTGTVTDLAESGALVIRFASGGTREIWFGDVTLRGTNDD